MQLTFTQFFRPKWQHPKAGVRKKAVNNLNPEQASDQQILLQLARMDQDVEVRCSALEKIANPSLLLDIAQTDPTPMVKEQATRQFCQMICSDNGSQEEDILASIEKLKDDDILTHIALNAKQLDVQIKAVSSISMQSALQQLVLNADNFQIRQLAAQGINEPDLLDQLIKLSRQKDKGVNRILRDTREQQKQQHKLAEQQYQQCQSLCASLEKLAKEDATDTYNARLEALLQRQQEISSDTLAQFKNRVQELEEICRGKLAEHQKQIEDQQRLQQDKLQRQSLLASLEQLTTGPFDSISVAALQSQWQQLQQQWQTLLQSSPAEQALQRQFEQSNKLIQSLVNSLTQLEDLADTLEQLNNLSLNKTKQTLSAIAWPDSLAPQPKVEALRQRLQNLQAQKQADQQARQQQLDGHTQKLDSLEAALEQGQLQEAAPLIKELSALIGEGHQATRSLKQRFQRLNAQYQELNGWQVFATQPKLEQLCEEMEALVNEELDGAERSNKLKAIQQQWREISSNQIPRNLRNRFQKASKEAYAPCQAYFEEQKAVRQENLQQRQQLVERLQQLVEKVKEEDSDSNFKQLAVDSRAFKQEWRKYTPVDRAPGKKLQTRFNELLQQTDQLLAKDQQRNADAKNQLIDQARQLLDIEDIQQAQNEAKGLQKKWRTIGPAKRKQEQVLWREFRSACNQLFEKSVAEPTPEAERKAVEIDRDWETIERRNQLCEYLEMELLSEGELKVEEQHLQAWKQGGHPDAPFGPLLKERFQWLIDGKHDQESIDRLLTEGEQELRLLCIRKEIIAGAQTPESDQVLRMEYQMQHLKKALEQHLAAPSEEELKTLEKLWYCIPFNQCHSELRERFHNSSAP